MIIVGGEVPEWRETDEYDSFGIEALGLDTSEDTLPFGDELLDWVISGGTFPSTGPREVPRQRTLHFQH